MKRSAWDTSKIIAGEPPDVGYMRGSVHEPDRACVRRTRRSGWNGPPAWIFQRSGALQPLRLVFDTVAVRSRVSAFPPSPCGLLRGRPLSAFPPRFMESPDLQLPDAHWGLEPTN